jgi:hypothetical protein
MNYDQSRTADEIQDYVDGIDFNYAGWEDDYETAVTAYANNHQSATSAAFRNAVHRLTEKQRVHTGDRSHPRLVALEQLAEALTYPGWQDDVEQAEQSHFETFYDSTRDDYFHSKLEGLQNRQQMYFGYNSQSNTCEASSNNPDIAAMLGACVICGERTKTHLFDPCGHLCACQSCANQVMRRDESATARAASCPICRVPSNKTIRVYFT